MATTRIDHIISYILRQRTISGLQGMPDINLSSKLKDLESEDLQTVWNKLNDLGHIKSLDLSNNNLSELPKELLKGIKGLERVNLSNNSFEEIPKTLYNSTVLSSLEKIDLSKNKLNSIGSDILNFTKLEEIYLKENAFNEIRVGKKLLKAETIFIDKIGEYFKRETNFVKAKRVNFSKVNFELVQDLGFKKLPKNLEIDIAKAESYESESNFEEAYDVFKNLGEDYNHLKSIYKAIELFDKLPTEQQFENKRYVLREQAKKVEDYLLLENIIRTGYKIKSLNISHLGILDDIHWNLHPNINILLGKNGFGKSHLLRLVALMLSQGNSNLTTNHFKQDYNSTSKSTVELLLEAKQYNTSVDNPLALSPFIKTFNKLTERLSTVGVNKVEDYEGRNMTVPIPILAISALRSLDKSKATLQKPLENIPEYLKDLSINGAYHFIEGKYAEEFFEKVLSDVYEESNPEKDQGDRLIHPALTEVARIIKDLTGREVIFKRGKYRAKSDKFKIILEDVQTLTEEDDTKNGGIQEKKQPLSLQQQSQGTISIIAIFAMIYDFLRDTYYVEQEIKKERLAVTSEIHASFKLLADLFIKPAIVMIDEIDAHLHPSWQRKIVNLLRETFPNVQFILTAHNPLIVAGCGKGEVAVLRKKTMSDGQPVQANSPKFTIQMFDESFVGKSTNVIYENIFEVEDVDENYLKLIDQYYFADLDRLKKKLTLTITDLKGKEDEASMRILKQTKAKWNEIKEFEQLNIDHINKLKLYYLNEQITKYEPLIETNLLTNVSEIKKLVKEYEHTRKEYEQQKVEYEELFKKMRDDNKDKLKRLNDICKEITKQVHKATEKDF